METAQATILSSTALRVKIAVGPYYYWYCQSHGSFLPDSAFNGSLWQITVYTARWGILETKRSIMNERHEKKTECVPTLGHFLQRRSRLMKARLWLTIAAAGYLIALSFSQAMAATTTTAPTITVNVAAACQVTPQNLNFGSYDSLATTNLSSTTQISINCSKNTTFTVELNAGQHASSGFNRNMANGANLLAYQLYTDSSHTTVWGDGTSGSGTLSGTGTGPGVAHAITETVYGEVPAQQSVPVGSYSDTITVTVAF